MCFVAVLRANLQLPIIGQSRNRDQRNQESTAAKNSPKL
jgi:hypothetical protein